MFYIGKNLISLPINTLKAHNRSAIKVIWFTFYFFTLGSRCGLWCGVTSLMTTGGRLAWQTRRITTVTTWILHGRNEASLSGPWWCGSGDVSAAHVLNKRGGLPRGLPEAQSTSGGQSETTDWLTGSSVVPDAAADRRSLSVNNSCMKKLIM